MSKKRPLIAFAGAVLLLSLAALASSHREAPLITTQPKVDGADFYLFRSYEPGREQFVTVVADYLPLQDAYGGPNYFSLDPDARYDIHVSNSGKPQADLTFRFRFQSVRRDLSLAIGPAGQQKNIAIPLVTTVGQVTPGDDSAINVIEQYRVSLVRGGREQAIRNHDTGAEVFRKPIDNIGNKTIPDYHDYAQKHLYSIDLPGCGTPGRMFVGQRKDPFVVNLGEAFDLFNLNPLGPVDGRPDIIADKNITSLILELPISCVKGKGGVIAGWTTASLPRSRAEREHGEGDDDFVQASRLANPLVNELVIGLKDKDKFNASDPHHDAQFLDYVTNPTLPAVLQALFGVKAPTLFPRADLIQVFLTGVPGLNADGSTAELMRLNLTTPVVAKEQQKRLGVIDGDVAGYPNGRRPGDDVVDISLRVVMGKLLPAAVAPDGQLPYTDGAFLDASRFPAAFPYLNDPLPGSPAN
jgi:Domain of unknown function (DUF4331)